MITLVIFGEHKLWNSRLYNFLHSPVFPNSFVQVSSSAVCSQIPQIYENVTKYRILFRIKNENISFIHKKYGVKLI
jgi:hypothetical protein